jgi:hypothetical protein
MKKLIYILPLLFVFGCTQDPFEEIYTYEPNVDIFEVSNTVVRDGDEININLSEEGEYKLSLIDEFTNITYTNEIFDGKVGDNKLNIYTKALPKGSYNLLVKDTKNNIIKQTTIKL